VIPPLFVRVTPIGIKKFWFAFTVIVFVLCKVKSLVSVASTAIALTALPDEITTDVFDKIEPLVLFSVPLFVIVPISTIKPLFQ
jgi:hypothetical protein